MAELQLNWEHAVRRLIYRALGETYGKSAVV